MEKILVVDDSVVQAAQLKSILSDDYDVTVAQTAEDADQKMDEKPVTLAIQEVAEGKVSVAAADVVIDNVE